MRNGAWQPLACTRLPECNFPVITLPNFSASVKDHLLTQWSRARAARRRGPSLGIIFNRQRKHIRSFLSGMCRVPERQAQGPAVAPTSPEPEPRRPPPHRALTHSDAPRPLPASSPRFSLVTHRGVRDMLTPTLKVIHLNSHQSGLSVTHRTFPGSPPLPPVLPHNHCSSTSSNRHPLTCCTGHLVTHPTHSHSHASIHRGTHSQTPF